MSWLSISCEMRGCREYMASTPSTCRAGEKIGSIQQAQPGPLGQGTMLGPACVLGQIVEDHCLAHGDNRAERQGRLVGEQPGNGLLERGRQMRRRQISQAIVIVA